MSPLRRIWMKLSGQPIIDPYEDIHRESAELTVVAKSLRAKLETYQRADDPLMAMFQDVWNRRQFMDNGSGQAAKH